MSDENASEIQSSVYAFELQPGRFVVGFCEVDSWVGPRGNDAGYLVVRNPLHCSMQLVRNPQTGEISPNLNFLPPNLVGVVEVMHLREDSVTSCFEAVGALREEYSKFWSMLMEATKPQSGIHLAKEISQADLQAAAAVERMKVR